MKYIKYFLYIILFIIAVVFSCSIADFSIGVSERFLEEEESLPRLPRPIISCDSSHDIMLNSVITLDVTTSVKDAVFHWGVHGNGSIDNPTSDSITFTASSTTEETAGIYCYITKPGYKRSDSAIFRQDISSVLTYNPSACYATWRLDSQYTGPIIWANIAGAGDHYIYEFQQNTYNYKTDDWTNGSSHTIRVRILYDQSGNSNNAIQTIENEDKWPLLEMNQQNGWPIITFDGSDDFLVCQSDTTLNIPQIDLFVSGQYDVGSSSWDVMIMKGDWDLGGPFGWGLFLNNTGPNDIGFYVDGFNTYNVFDNSFPMGAHTLLEGKYDQLDVRFYTNSTIENTGSSYNTALSDSFDVGIGATPTGLNPFSGNISSINIYESLTNYQRQNISSYINKVSTIY